MERTRDRSADRTTATDRSETEFYLPGIRPFSTDGGRVGRFITRLFRRRGVLPADLLFASDAGESRHRRGD
jgi:hypothetical protein